MRDVFTEPTPDPNTLPNLGPLRGLAGLWMGSGGVDTHPSVDGSESNEYIERIELQPIDAQTNGPQLFYGLRYHAHMVKPGEVERTNRSMIAVEPRRGRGARPKRYRA